MYESFIFYMATSLEESFDNYLNLLNQRALDDSSNYESQIDKECIYLARNYGPDVGLHNSVGDIMIGMDVVNTEYFCEGKSLPQNLLLSLEKMSDNEEIGRVLGVYKFIIKGYTEIGIHFPELYDDISYIISEFSSSFYFEWVFKYLFTEIQESPYDVSVIVDSISQGFVDLYFFKKSKHEVGRVLNILGYYCDDYSEEQVSACFDYLGKYNHLDITEFLVCVSEENPEIISDYDEEISELMEDCEYQERYNNLIEAVDNAFGAGYHMPHSLSRVI